MKRMTSGAAATTLALLCCTFAACAGPREGELHGVGPARGLETLPWVPFRWEGATIAGQHVERAALMVPVVLEGITSPVEFQLDTGTGWTVLYGAPLDQLRPPGIVLWPDSTAEVSGVIAGLRVVDELVRVLHGEGDSVRVGEPTRLGSLGLRFLEGRTLVLDFPRRRVAVLEGDAPLPASLEASAEWVEARERNGHLFVPVTVGGETDSLFFFDTGASLFPLSTSAERWRRLTGREGDEPDNAVWDVSSWGQSVRLVGAPVEGAVRIGDLEVPRPLVFHVVTEAPFPDFDKWPYPVHGLFGNALFYDDHVVVVDLPRGRFGLLRRP